MTVNAVSMVNKVNEVTAATVTEKERDLEREKRLDRAARELVDEIWPIKDKLEKACLLLADLTDEYFRRYNSEDDKDQFAIRYEFSRNAIFADIIDDYVFQAKKELAELEQRADRAKEV